MILRFVSTFVCFLVLANSAAAESNDKCAIAYDGLVDDSRVDINNDSITKLQTLKGVGIKRAENIISLRDRLSGLKRITQLLYIKGIGKKSLRKIRKDICIGPYKRKELK